MTLLPLYAMEPRPRRERSGNAGLWYDKFCDRWGEGWTMKADASNPKLDWMNTLADEKGVGERESLRAAGRRLGRLAGAAGGRVAVFRTRSRFVTGLGRSHPVENGFAWHHTLGVPYLPGSSVKGLVHAWAKEWEGISEDELQRIFGGVGRVGTFCFLDAVPFKPVKLEADILTPHYAGWKPEDPPGDWRSPVPSPFLVVAEGARLVFGILPTSRSAHGDLDTVWEWLKEALENLGAGAKTAVGYGRFVPDEKATSTLEELIHRSGQGGQAGLSGLREPELLEEIRVKLEKDGLTDPAERAAFAREVLGTYRDRINSWRRGKKTDSTTTAGAKKLKERAKLILREATGQGGPGS